MCQPCFFIDNCCWSLQLEKVLSDTNKTKYYWDNGKVWTPYGKNGRKPVEGAEYIRDNDVGKIIKSLNKINSTKEGKYILSKLSASSNEYKIRNEQKGDSYACYVRSEKTVYMNKNNGIGVLSHELFHAFQDLNGRGEASIYNEVEAYVFQGMVSTSLEVDDYNSGMKAPKDFPDEELANKYINAMKNLVTNFNYKDFKIAIKNFKKVSKANNIRGKYNNYRLIPNRHVLTTGSLLKKVR